MIVVYLSLESIIIRRKDLMASNTWKVEIIIEDQITEDNTYNAKSLADEIEHHILAHTTGLKILELKAGLIAAKVDDQG